MRNIRHIKDRLLEKVEFVPECGCWLWVGATTKREGGYGRIKVKGATCVCTHILSYSLFNGKIPDGMKVLHKCDVPACVNPHHLFLGSQKDNVHDMVTKRRHAWRDNPPPLPLPGKARGERAGSSKLTSEQVMAIFNDPRTNMAIAADYPINDRHVSNIKLKKAWRHLWETP